MEGSWNTLSKRHKFPATTKYLSTEKYKGKNNVNNDIYYFIYYFSSSGCNNLVVKEAYIRALNYNDNPSFMPVWNRIPKENNAWKYILNINHSNKNYNNKIWPVPSLLWQKLVLIQYKTIYNTQQNN